MNLIHSAGAAIKRQRRAVSLVRAACYWGLPPVLIYLIVRKVDLAEVGAVLTSANLLFVGMGMLVTVLVVAAGSLRWWWLVGRLGLGFLPVWLSVVGYWRSLAIGVTMPGSLGEDAYRTLMVGRLTGRYWSAAFAIIIEKFSAVLTYGGLVVMLFPFLPANRLPGAVGQVIDGLGLLLLVVGLGMVVGASLHRRAWMRDMLARVQTRLGAVARRIAGGATAAPDKDGGPDSGSGICVSAFWSPGVLAPALGFSLLLQICATLQTQLYFAAFGCEISFLANLFVNQILFFLFLLPISFGGIGVREGAYILLYGAFGVPEETALVIALCSFLGLLFSYAVGACLFLWKVPVLALPLGRVAPGGPEMERSVLV